MSVRLAGIIAATMVMSILLGACSGDDVRVTASPTSVTASPQRTASVTPTASPSTSTSTPVARPNVPSSVDHIINLVLRGDAAALEQLVRLTPVPCGPQLGGGSP